MKNATIKSAVLGVTLAAGSACLQAQTFPVGSSYGLNAANDVFNNYTGVTPVAGLGMTNGVELGNEIFMPVTPNDNYMTNFTFEYYGTTTAPGGASFSGDVQVQINFYLNTGPALNGYLSPAATPFYSWNSATILGGSYAGSSVVSPGVANYFNLGPADFANYVTGPYSYTQGVLIPYTSGEQLTYTVTFTGLGAGDTIGLTSVAGSAIGTVVSGYWIKEPNGSFQYLTNGVDDASQAEIEAVPEPTSMALVGVGALTLIAAAKRRFVK